MPSNVLYQQSLILHKKHVNIPKGPENTYTSRERNIPQTPVLHKKAFGLLRSKPLMASTRKSINVWKLLSHSLLLIGENM